MLATGSTPQAATDRNATPFQGAVTESSIGAEIRDAMAHLRRRRLGIIVAALVMAGVGAILAETLPRQYTSTAQIMVDPRGLRVFDNEVVPNGQVPDVQSALVETQSRVMKSDSVLKPVVEQEHLAQDPEFDGDSQSLAASVIRFVRTTLLGHPVGDKAATALDRLNDAVKVARLPTSFVIELSVQSKDADKAARLAQAITQTFIANQDQMRQDAATKVSDGLAMRLDELSGSVNRAETAVDTFKRDHNIIDTNGRPVNEQQLGDITNQLIAARVHTGELRARYEQLQKIQRSGVVPDATVEAVQSPTIVQLRSRYAAVKQQADMFRTSLGPRHPSLLAADAQLDGVRQLIADEIRRIAASVRTDYERAQATQDGLARQVAAITQENGTVNTATIQLRQLEREAQARRAVYESFLTRSRETREQGDLPIANIAVISPAVPPLKPSGIPGILIVAIMAAFGASAAAIGILAYDHLSGRLMTPRQLALATSLPLLAVARRRSRAVTGLFRWRRKGEPPKPRTSERSLAVLYDALEDVSPPTPPRIVLFLSASEAAAGSRLPLDLARTACAAGRRVLLIDTDGDSMTRPLDTGANPDRRGWSPVKQTSIPNLSVLPWKGSFGKPLGTEAPGGPSTMRMAAEHDFIFVHGSSDNPLPRLRHLSDAATNIILMIDSDAASIGSLDAIRHEIGSAAPKVNGFVWVTSAPDRGGKPKRTEAPTAPATFRPPDVSIRSTRTDAA